MSDMGDNVRKTFRNDASSFLMEELQQRLAENGKAFLAFGGDSMLPMLKGDGDIVELRPVDNTLQRGNIYLFVNNNHFVVHRLRYHRGDTLVFRGDNCLGEEHVSREDVLARLVAVEHADGSREECDSPRWRRRSRWVAARRTLVNLPLKAFCRKNRRWERWLYFAILLLLMWAPVGVVGVPLNNFVLGIRLDHLLHASVFIPCTFFLMDFSFFSRHKDKRRGTLLLLSGILTGIVTESVQYLLPYRGFDINDLVANFLGVSLGFLSIFIFYRKRLRKKCH